MIFHLRWVKFPCPKRQDIKNTSGWSELTGLRYVTVSRALRAHQPHHIGQPSQYNFAFNQCSLESIRYYTITAERITSLTRLIQTISAFTQWLRIPTPNPPSPSTGLPLSQCSQKILSLTITHTWSRLGSQRTLTSMCLCSPQISKQKLPVSEEYRQS